MKRIFLGPALHWAIVAVLIALGWLAGTDRLHVIRFNLFLVVLLVLTAAAVLVVLRTSPPGRKVTRDPIEED